MKRQRAVITITDDDNGGIRSDLVFEPSLKGRRDNSPSVNAALRIALLIKGSTADLIAPITAPTAGAEAPSTNLQAPQKLQAPTSK